MTDDTVHLLGEALDEIYRLRTALAYEAGVIASHLQLASFPKSRRDLAEEQVLRMRNAARGSSARAYDGIRPASLKHVREQMGIEILTRSMFEDSRCRPSS